VHEWIHRCVLFVVSSLVILSMVFGILGANVYLDSGRSFTKDLSTSTGYIWKKGSCDELFRGVSLPLEESPGADQTKELCDMARDNHLPPLSLKTIIDAQLRNLTPDKNGRPVIGPGQARAVIRESRAAFIRELPALKAYYEPYQKRVSCMWLFLPALAGSVAAYLYARSCAPVLFAALKRRFERALFGKSRYEDGWQSFIKPKKRP
jgi:hypothetical protein